MKKNTSLATIAGIVVATFAFLKFSKDIPPGVPPDAPEDPPGTAAKKYCLPKFGDLTYRQYQLKLFNLDVAFEEGRITREVYDKDRTSLIYCRGPWPWTKT